MKKIYVLALSLMMVSFAFAQRAEKSVRFVKASELTFNSQKSVTVADYEQDFNTDADFATMGFTQINVDGNTVTAGWSALELTFADGWMELVFNSDPDNGFASSISEFDPAGQADRWLITPEVAIAGAGRVLSWSAMSSINYAGEATADDYEVYITTSIAGAAPVVADFTDAAAVTITGEASEWTSHTFDLDAAGYTTGTIYVAFRLVSNDQGIFLLDNIVVEQPPVDPVASISATEWNAGNIEVSTSTTSADFTLTNIEAGTMTVASVTDLATTDFATSFVEGDVSLASGESYTFTFTYNAPATAGTSNATFSIVTNGGTVDVALAGEAHAPCTAITSFPYTESFEDGLPVCWSLNDADADTYNWGAFEDESAYDGGVAMVSNSWTSASGALSPDNYMITPQFEVNAENLELKFWVAAYEFEYPVETYSVSVSTSGTAPADFADVLHTETLADDVWREVVLSLAAYNGQSIYIAFRHFDSYDNNMIMIDLVSIELGATSVNTIDNNSVSLFPNPTTGIVNISNADNNTVVVYNMIGQVVTSVTNAQTIDMTGFENGTYIVKVISENETITKKINLIK